MTASAKATTAKPDWADQADPERARLFLLWARKNGFSVTYLKVGEVELNVVDFRITEPVAATETVKPPRTVHDQLADEMGLPRPSDVTVDDDEDEA
jgi:hypothetical protein